MHSRCWRFRHVGLDTTYDARSSQYAVVLRNYETLRALWYAEIYIGGPDHTRNPRTFRPDLAAGTPTVDISLVG